MCMNWFIFSYWFETFQVTAYPASSWWGRDFTAISQYNLQCIDKIFFTLWITDVFVIQVEKVQKPVLSTILSGQSYSVVRKKFWIYVEMNFSKTTMTVIALDDRLSVT